MEKTVNRPRFLVILSAVMAAVMLAISPLQVFAVNEKAANTYISELIVVTGDQLKDEKLKDYTVVETPIFENKIDQGNATYLAFKTTNRPEEAITDLRVMNMNGNYSFEEYDAYMSDLRAQAEKMAAQLWDSVEEFRELYNNEETRTENVEYAYDLMNLLYDDDIVVDGSPVRMGELLADEKIIPGFDDENGYFTTIFLESNLDALRMISTALANACSKTGGMTFLEKLAEDPRTAVETFCDDDTLDDSAAELKRALDTAREKIGFYLTAEYDSFPAEEKLNDFLEDLSEQDKQDGSSRLSDWLDGFLLTKELSAVEYYGTEGDFETLFDLITAPDELYEDDEYMLPNLRPIVGVMSEGMRPLLSLGLASLVSICVTGEGEYYATMEELKNDSEYEDVFADGISIFSGVDREIYEEHAVAMTGAAINANANDDTSWHDAGNAKSEKLHKLGTRFAIVAGVFGGFSLLVGWGMMSVGSTVAFSDYVVWLARGLVGGIGVSLDVGGRLFAMFLSWSVVVAVGALIATIVLFVLSKKYDIPDYTDYSEIPGMLCDYRKESIQKETDGNFVETSVEKYVYYKGAVNPVGVRETAQFGDGDGQPQALPENRKGVMDIYDWSLRSTRQWIAVYTTKDRYAGYPILSDSLAVCAENKSGLFAAEFGAEKTEAFDFSEIYNHSAEVTKNSGKKAAPVYLTYLSDENAVYTDSAEQQVMDRLVGSAVSNGAAWAMSAIGLALGCVGGFLVGKNTKKKKVQ